MYACLYVRSYSDSNYEKLGINIDSYKNEKKKDKLLINDNILDH